MTDIQTIKETLSMQYVLEDLLETYNNAETESERLLVLYNVIDYIDNCEQSLDKIKQYLKLQPEKFEPFLNLVLKISKTSLHKSASSLKKPVKVEVYTFME